MRLSGWVHRALDGQRGNLFPWAPVLFGTGIAVYFSLTWEPGGAFWSGFVAFMAITLAAGWLRGAGRRLLVSGMLLAMAGFATAGLRAHGVAGKVLTFRYYGPVEGRIVGIDRSASDALRLTLDNVRLSDVLPGRTPARIRIALHGDQSFLTPEPGLTVVATAHLSPPGGAVEPGGYDFRRQAWFERIGAVGYTRSPVLAFAGHQGQDIPLALYRLRMRLAGAISEALPGPAGAFAAGITTGDRSEIDQDVLVSLRKSNLAHLLAI